MTRSQLVVKNVLRNPRRTVLAMGSVATSTFLLAILCAAYQYMIAPPEVDRYNLVLVVSPRVSISVLLPISYRERIAKVPGVVAVMPICFFDGRYGPEGRLVPAAACDPETLLTFADFDISPEQRRVFLSEKGAAVARRELAQKHGWKIGDRIHLSSPNYHVELELVLRGIYTTPEDQSMIFFNWAYLNEALGTINKTTNFDVLARYADDVPKLTRDIDALFRNADVETYTQPIKQHMLDFLGWMGNVKLVLLGVSAAVIFAVLLIVANSMAMSIRERTAEIAVLRALGFRTPQILGMLAAESLGISLVGAAVGCLSAWILLKLTGGLAIGGILPARIQVDGATVLVVLAAATAISLASTLIPAYRASHANIAEALRYVG